MIIDILDTLVLSRTAGTQNQKTQTKGLEVNIYFNFLLILIDGILWLDREGQNAV